MINPQCFSTFTSVVNLDEPETDFATHAAIVIESCLNTPEGCQESQAHKIFELLSEAEHSGKLDPEFINLFTGESKYLLTWLVPYLIYESCSPSHMKGLLGSADIGNQRWTGSSPARNDWYSIFSTLMNAA